MVGWLARAGPLSAPAPLCSEGSAVSPVELVEKLAGNYLLGRLVRQSPDSAILIFDAITDCPYGPDTDEGRSWIRGWLDEDELLMENYR